MSSECVLYIIMRTDIASLTPGKGMAQASHAYGALKSRIRSALYMQPAYLTWMDTTPQGFGTTIVLGGNEAGIQRALDTIYRLNLQVLADWVTDPTYPIKDGEILHLINLKTCAYVFGTRELCADVVGSFVLYD